MISYIWNNIFPTNLNDSNTHPERHLSSVDWITYHYYILETGMILINLNIRKIGESLFLRKLVLGIPAQASGKNLTRPLMPSAPQPSCVRATSPHHRKLGAGYVALPQMTGRRFGKPFILSPPTLALRFRQNNGPTPTGDYQPSRSLSMADSERDKNDLTQQFMCKVSDTLLKHFTPE